jgi:hypothetical protein
MKPSAAGVWARLPRSRRHSPSPHVSESGTSRCGHSGQGAAGRARGGGWAIQSQTAQHGPPGCEWAAPDAKQALPERILGPPWRLSAAGGLAAQSL